MIIEKNIELNIISKIIVINVEIKLSLKKSIFDDVLKLYLVSIINVE
tara:strand:- start:46 stop:186 length:141 start_codon:yes stop_codon:yes gene_type:complete